MDRLQLNDLVINSYISTLKWQGINTAPLEKTYEKQRAVIEAEEAIKDEHKTH